MLDHKFECARRRFALPECILFSLLSFDILAIRPITCCPDTTTTNAQWPDSPVITVSLDPSTRPKVPLYQPYH